MQGIYMSESDLPESNTFRCCFQSHLDGWCSSEHALHRDGNQFPGTTLWNLMHRQQYTSVHNILYLTCLACHHVNTVCTNWTKDNFPATAFGLWEVTLCDLVTVVRASSNCRLRYSRACWEWIEVFYSCKQSQQYMKVAANCVYQRYHCQWYCWWFIIYLSSFRQYKAFMKAFIYSV